MKREILEEILKAGVRAPSADNSQPWKFVLTGTGVWLRLDPGRTFDFASGGHLMLYVSAGAVIENIRVAAQTKGYGLQVCYFPGAKDRLVVASLSFEAVQGQGGHAHQRALEARVTNRRFYSGRWLDPEVYGRLEKAAVAEGMRLLWIKKQDPRYKMLERVLGQADSLRYEVERLHREFMKTLRYGPAKAASEGLPIDALEAGPGSRFFFKLMSSWPVMKAMNLLKASAALGFYTQLQMKTSQAAGLLITSDSRPLDYTRGGEVMERIWHEATVQGIAMQPMEALPIFIVNWKLNQVQDFSEKQKRLLLQLKEKFESLFQLQEKNGLVMLWRVGYAPAPSARSNRRPIQSFIVENENANLSV